MFARFRDWLDHRTGYRKLRDALFLEHIPGGARWRYVWGSCLVFVFMIQLVTGILLMTAYSPGDSTAWGSVYYIQYEMDFGWFIRGLHHFGSQAMVVLLAIHMLQVVIAGAHLPPREINWWLGLLLMGLVLAMSLTGYLLPWDQKGYWATQVATSIAGSIPGIGDFLRRVIVGGPEYGHATLTRFYALHVGILPALIVILLVAHVAIFRRHGITAPKNAEGEGLFWPDQAFRDMLACMAVFGIMLGLVIWGGHGNPVEHSAFYRPTAEQIANKVPAPEPGWWEHTAFGGRDGRGANLDAPADPSGSYPARPEWYFLFLFQLLKYFPGQEMIIGTVFVPNGVVLVLFLLPLLSHGRLRPLAHVLSVIFVVALLAAIGSLTCLALADDMDNPECRLLLTQLAYVAFPAVGGFVLIYFGLLAILREGRFRRSVSVIGGVILALALGAVGSLIYGAMGRTLPEPLWTRLEEEVQARSQEDPKGANKKQEDIKLFRHQLEKAEAAGKRAVELAPAGIPAEGATLLLQRDPKTRGKELFKQNCAVCHSWNYDPRTGLDYFHTDPDPKKKPKFTAGDLDGFATKEWIRGLLNDPGDPKYFGRTELTGMKKWKKDLLKERARDLKRKPEDTKKAIIEAEQDFDLISEWLAEQALPKDKRNAKLGVIALDKFLDHCSTCHSIENEGGRSAPDFTDYGSQEWIRLMIVAPNHPSRHGRKNQMPAFRNLEGPGTEILQRHFMALDKGAPGLQVIRLSDVERELIIRWMTGDERVVFGGSPIQSAPGKR